MASVSLITFRDMLCLEGQDYQTRQIRMYPVEARHTGHNNAVTDAAGVLNVLAGRSVENLCGVISDQSKIFLEE